MKLMYVIVALAALVALVCGRETNDLFVETSSSSVRIQYVMLLYGTIFK